MYKTYPYGTKVKIIGNLEKNKLYWFPFRNKPCFPDRIEVKLSGKIVYTYDSEYPLRDYTWDRFVIVGIGEETFTIDRDFIECVAE